MGPVAGSTGHGGKGDRFCIRENETGLDRKAFIRTLQNKIKSWRLLRYPLIPLKIDDKGEEE